MISLTERLARRRDFKALAEPPRAEGRLTRLVGLTLEAAGLNLPVGQTCSISGGSAPVTAEVVGFSGANTFLMPITPPLGLSPGAKVRPVASGARLRLGPACLGRVFDGLGRPLDGMPAPAVGTPMGSARPPINPLARRPIDRALDVGIRAINTLLTVGEGQRLGLFAGTGVGKSVLLGMMTRNTAADVVVVGLIGERGREVQEFIQQSLGAAGLARAVVVAAPADDAPLMRLRAAELATQIAEFYRDQGAKVLLLMDSLTRFGQAQRELALAIGEPPATRGYPPSVFAKIPALVERAGNCAAGQGSITAFYTVLTEGDDLQDPIADAARGILDGHIVLSRSLADEGIYPAIEVEASVSRVMPHITDAGQRALALEFKQLLSRYRANRDFIAIGAYKAGTDPGIDRAVERYPQLMKFLGQGMTEKAPMAASLEALTRVLKPKA